MTPGRALLARLLLGGLGVGLMAYGLAGFLRDRAVTTPVSTALWLAGVLVAHDWVLVPLVCLAGVVLARLLPPAVRSPVRAGLVVAGVLALVALPTLLKGWVGG